MANLFSFCRVSSHLRPYCYPNSPHSQFTRDKPLSCPLSQSTTLFTRDRRGRRRKNTLREKLLFNPKQQDQVRPIPLPFETPQDNNDKLRKLETWVRRQSEDSEFWGIGSNPIFTIYQDTDGNVVSVSVNEDEIVNRSRVFEEVDVGSKIARAKRIANEIEAGIYTLPLNSSIAKFVVEGNRSVLVQRVPFLRAFPRTGFMVLCTFCVLGVAAKLFAGNGEVKLKREEVDMLRRKKKSRMEKEKLDKGSVEVVRNVQGLPMASYARPQLDRNELMKCIEHAEKSQESLVLTDSSHHLISEDCDFDNKVREIREMAREARELEQQDHAENDERQKGNELSSVVHVSNGHIVADAYVEPKPMKIGLDQDIFSDNGKDIKLSAETENNKAARENSKDSINVIADGEASNISVINTDTVPGNVDVHETDTFELLKPLHSSVEKSANGINSNTLRSLHDLRNEEVKQNEIESINFVEKESSCISSGTLSSVRNIPKIMKSVKDAKEYLSEKYGSSTDKLQSRQEGQLNCSAAGVSAWARPNDDKADVKISQPINENRAVDPSNLSTTEIYGDVDSVSLLKGSFANDVSKTNFHEVGIRDAMFSMRIDENKALGKNNLPHDILSGSITEKLSSVSVAEQDSTLDDLITDRMVYPSKSLLGAINAENTCSRTIKTKNLNVERKSIKNQSAKDNNAHTLYTSDKRQGSESPETSCNDHSSVASSVGDRQGRVDNGPNNSKALNNFPNQGHFDSEGSKTFQDGFGVCNVTTNGPKVNKGWEVTVENKKVDSPDTTLPAVKSFEESSLNTVEFDGNASQLYTVKDDTLADVKPFILGAALESGDNHDMNGLLRSEKSFQLGSAGPDHDTETFEPNGHESRLEDNFQKIDPVIKTIRTGFRENYMLAKEKVQQSVVSAEVSELGLLGEDDELEWMNDEKIREIVFQVRDNELAGRDPFHLMDAADQRAFFQGLELKAEKVNEKLSGLHEWIHSKIENLDYGTDSISLDDPLEKIVPCWKGPTVDKELDFLHKFTEHKMENFTGKVEQSHVVKEQKRNNLQKSEELPYYNGVSPCSSVNDKNPNGASTSAKTLIEGSDGSRRPGKKTGKEHWQHTKKWSRGFLEVYNAETDPEIKSIMKDMGKGLDRWITEKETQEVADLMTRIPKRRRRYIQKKMDKLKREVDMYGAQAVVSKYKEYSDEKEEDYLWWLDLQFVLCIELYTMEEDVPKAGFYSLEMATDLELHPKQYHVIAFEDPGDSKNFCYIIQAHMDMLGSGKAFVVARPPKDAFREAKANGFNVTVIKKGELKFNVDQTLEEVEEEITEIGSKIYHDKIMRERAVDIRTLMKGVVRADKATKR